MLIYCIDKSEFIFLSDNLNYNVRSVVLLYLTLINEKQCEKTTFLATCVMVIEKNMLTLKVLAQECNAYSESINIIKLLI